MTNGLVFRNNYDYIDEVKAIGKNDIRDIQVFRRFNDGEDIV